MAESASSSSNAGLSALKDEIIIVAYEETLKMY